MPRQYCKYHPLEPALWYDPRSHAAYCERCVDSGETLGGVGQAKCYLYGNELTYLGSANTAQPFWERLGAFFRFPFKRASLIIMGLLILLMVLISVVGAPSIFVAVVGGIFVLAFIARYGFLVLEQSAEGRFHPPTLGEAFSGSGFNILFQQIAVQIIFVGFTVVVSFLESGFLNAIASALVVLIWPASMMLLAMERSITLAVNPSAIWHLIRSIGWAYLLLYAFLFLLLGAQATLFQVFVQEIPPRLLLPGFVGLMFYFLIVSFHLMGYVVFQYQSDIGFVAEDQLAKEKRRLKVEPVNAVSELMIKEGQYERAVQVLTKYLKQNPDSIRHHENLAKLLLALRDRNEALAHGQFFLNLLSERGDDARLYFLFSRYLELDQGFKPEQPGVCLCLAEQLFLRGKYQQVCQLLANMHKSAPDFDLLPDAYLLMARSLLDGFNNESKASQYLKFVKAKYPTFSQLGEVEALLLECGGAV
ncbi:hypothetical protein FT643_01775 [Ketobacter sp. MCCC 1A13808]|uniref:tetratricopeptide repeat protein n=1 Tax=Ketobacter sp. MCCC 1A13808 TaxID=2602738 RepID=UPI0012EC1F81|nr:tetratricopeptide repeat protein [Ketobacter sp. MCCC 1A13808]MVF10859.1 hypothetical protein [Ketobacter sp. MCCC 1A13808]